LVCRFVVSCLFVVDVPASFIVYTLSLHDALPICFAKLWAALLAESYVRSEVDGTEFFARLKPARRLWRRRLAGRPLPWFASEKRSEEHTSELQSRVDLVCRLLLEKKNPRSKKMQN